MFWLRVKYIFQGSPPPGASSGATLQVAQCGRVGMMKGDVLLEPRNGQGNTAD